MTSSLLTILAALLGLGLLIFLHELGHFWVARRAGIRVEVFSIGFGRPIWSRQINGVDWRIGIFPFGGYVRLAGMEMEEEALQNPAPGSYFASPVSARIAAIAAGPAANVLISFLCCLIVFVLGGRLKSWSELSPYIGSIPAGSALEKHEVALGDRVAKIDGSPYSGARDLLLASLSDGPLSLSLVAQPFSSARRGEYSIQVRRSPASGRALLWRPAKFLRLGTEGKENPLVEGSPLLEAGAQLGDRLIWMDGVLLWNEEQVSSLLNDGKVLLTVMRNGRPTLVRSPRIRYRAADRPDLAWKDWWLQGGTKRASDFWILAAPLDSSLTVGSPAAALSKEEESVSLPFLAYQELKRGDRIVAVDGFSVQDGPSLVAQLQKRVAHVVVERAQGTSAPLSLDQAQEEFLKPYSAAGLSALAQGLMEGKSLLAFGELVMLQPVAVKPLSQFAMGPARADTIAVDAHERRLKIMTMPDGAERRAALAAFEREQTLNVLGVRMDGWQDVTIRYNPEPFGLFADQVAQVWMTLKGLVTGKISGQHVNSPVGVFVAMKNSWASSFTEGVYLLGFISLSLAVFNLLPLPVLDGGHIVIALVEGLTGRRPSARLMKWLFLPFFIGLLGLMAYTVWNDLSQIFGWGA
jgi:regulator of sigma E protease